MKIEAVVGALHGAIGYLVYDHADGTALIIDAPLGTTPHFLAAIRAAGVSLLGVVSTHGHLEQIADNSSLCSATKAVLLAHVWDGPRLSNPELASDQTQGPRKLGIAGLTADRYLRDGEELDVGDLSFTVMHTPGHTPGSLCLYERHSKALFSGETILGNGTGRTDLAGGNKEQLRRSLQKLLQLPDTTRIFPSYGMPTTMRQERWALEMVNVRSS